ncbi:MAG TPA: aminodeoxychorismate synthase component I [Bacteroidia bacterium]|nr:aminodeoxychorismate synthase component I [Bacteroidia bacterium]
MFIFRDPAINSILGLFCMVRKRINYALQESGSLLDRVFDMISSHSCGIVLLSNNNTINSFEWIGGIGKIKEFTGADEKNVFEEFRKFLDSNKDWTFGHLSYDLKNAIEKLNSDHPDGIQFPYIHFFVPELLITKNPDSLSAEFSNENDGKKLSGQNPSAKNIPQQKIKLLARSSRKKYISDVNSLLDHIRRGDIYEINYCIEFFAEHVKIDPVSVFKKLNQLTEAPFSALYRNGEQWLICASPERFLRKNGNKITSQPIKGTRPRGKNPADDLRLKDELMNDPKERSENVMIVDLVRNDLSRSAKKGSVKVEELFGIHTFKNVHQMISTVSAKLDEHVHPVQAIKNAFPMGSMTGAPKVRAMELAEEFENMRRGLYSGAVGYFTPGMDFDFNVVIRSIQYNSKTGYLSLMVGSAITAKSDPEKEYSECLVKAETLFRALGVELNETNYE